MRVRSRERRCGRALGEGASAGELTLASFYDEWRDGLAPRRAGRQREHRRGAASLPSVWTVARASPPPEMPLLAKPCLTVQIRRSASHAARIRTHAIVAPPQVLLIAAGARANTLQVCHIGAGGVHWVRVALAAEVVVQVGQVAAQKL